MIRRALLWALEVGLERRSLDATTASLRELDPLLAAIVRRRLARLRARVAQQTNREEPEHLLRLMHLAERGRIPEADYEDVAGIAQEFGLGLGVRRPPRGPWLLTALGMVTLLTLVIPALVYLWLRPYDPSQSPLGTLLARQLSSYVVACQPGHEPQQRQALGQAVLAAPGTKPLGASGTERLREVVQAMDALASSLLPLDERGPLRDRLVAATVSFDGALRDAALPYYVDADVAVAGGGEIPIVTSYYVESEREALAESQRVRALRLRRLDNLTFQMPVLGFTRASSPAALVLLDTIETDLVRFVLPALVEGERLEMVDEETEKAAPAWVKTLSDDAAAAVRRHYASVPPALQPGVLRVGQLLARRRALVERWRVEVSALGGRLRLPNRLIPEADYAQDLELKVPRAQLREWDSIHEELSRGGVYQAFCWLRDQYVEAVERHEIQHRLDYARGLRPLPSVLARHLGQEGNLDLPEGSLAARSRDETSAYLASIATANAPLLDLVLLGRHLFDRDSLGGPYSYAALVVLETIARQLGEDPNTYFGERGVRRDDAARLFAKVIGRSSQEIQAAAQRGYLEQFGYPAAALTLRTLRQYPSWRH